VASIVRNVTVPVMSVVKTAAGAVPVAHVVSQALAVSTLSAPTGAQPARVASGVQPTAAAGRPAGVAPIGSTPPPASSTGVPAAPSSGPTATRAERPASASSARTPRPATLPGGALQGPSTAFFGRVTVFGTPPLGVTSFAARTSVNRRAVGRGGWVPAGTPVSPVAAPPAVAPGSFTGGGAGGGSGLFFFGLAAVLGLAGVAVPRLVCPVRPVAVAAVREPFLRLLARPG
jgi:hypothetical protein